MLAIGILLGYKMNDKADMGFITKLDGEGSYPIGRVEEVLRYIDSKYVNDIDTDSLSNIAINSIINNLDPHSVYITPEEMDRVNESVEGNFKGIGIESLFLNDTVNIVQVMEDGPSKEAGLQSFDQLIYIGDKNVAGVKVPFTDIRNLLKGQPGEEEVSIKIKRKGEINLLSYTIPLRSINISSADLAHMINDSVGIIKVDQFTENTYQEFMQSMEYLSDSMGMRHLIIDLRDNPGGILPQVTKIINQLFQEKGRLIVYTEGDHSNKTEYTTNGKVFFYVDKLAVLVNENSASASEILAGVVQDWDRGVIIGRRSYGKGLVQEQYNLSNGGAVRLTIAKYFTPSGRSIQKDYSQRSDYDNELQDRLDKGYLTEADTSMLINPIKTLLLGREIASNNGISPDIFIKGNDIDYSVSSNSLLLYAYEFIYKKIKDSADLQKYLKIDDAIYQEYISYMNEVDSNIKTNEIEPSEKAEILKHLRFQYKTITLSKNEAQIDAYAQDPFIDKALEYFKSNRSLSVLK